MIHPYLRFNGNCEEAFNFYTEAFGGKSVSLSRFDNDPNKKIMHAQVKLTENGWISGSDHSDDERGKKIVPVEILVHLPSRENVESILAKLSEGGTDINKFQPHPPPDDAGGGAGVTDKYGHKWMLCAMC
jgi:PhnB protein